MTTPTEETRTGEREAAVALRATRERRLHPWSWLFVLLAQLREFALPLIALLFFGRGGDSWWEWVGLGAAVALPVLAVVQYFTYRFHIADGELVVRSGILHRNVRNIPLSRIQNVALKRNPLHRLFGVAEVRLESAVGGTSAEAQMRVLSMHDAQALEMLVQARGAQAPDGVNAEAASEDETLLRLGTPELVKLGLTSNRGLLLGAAGFGVFSQLDDTGLLKRAGSWVEPVFGQARDLHLGWVHWLLIGMLLIALGVLLLRLVSIGLVLLQFHGFRLSQHGQRLSVEGGLLTRTRSHAPLRKIQHWTIRENLVHRWFDRRSLKIETAALQAVNQPQSMSDVVPIAPPQRIDALLRRWLPWFELQAMQWRPLHPRAWRRLFTLPAIIAFAIAGVIVLRFGWIWPLLLLPFALALMAWRARRIATSASWAVTDRVLVWRSGWLDRRVSFAELHKLQGLQLRASPFDRRHRMASVIADSAGANPFGHRLELHYLPEVEARALFELLGSRVAQSPLRW